MLTAGAFVSTVHYGTTIASGFELDRTILVTVHLRPLADSENPAVSEDFGRSAARSSLDAMEQIRALPGVELVSLGEPPLGADAQQTLASPRFVETERGRYLHPAGWRSGGPEYLAALGIHGGQLDEDEAIVTPALARHLWADESPIGKHLRTDVFSGTVVGVADVAIGSLRLGRPPALITFDRSSALSAVLGSTGRLRFVVRAKHSAELRKQIRSLLAKAFPDALRIEATLGPELVAADLGRELLGAWFFSAYALVTFVLGLVSIFGLVAHIVDSRRREFSVMIALGAGSTVIKRAAMALIVPSVGVGAVLGALMAALLLRASEALLLGFQGINLLTYVVTIGPLVGCSALAAWAATARLRMISPLEALRAA
jgi:hypothetical protein